MANHHLRNKALSLKAKGLLSLMLSLPENWDYTTKGLAAICKDGTDSIGYTNHICEICGNSYITDMTPIISHAYERTVTNIIMLMKKCACVLKPG